LHGSSKRDGTKRRWSDLSKNICFFYSNRSNSKITSRCPTWFKPRKSIESAAQKYWSLNTNTTRARLSSWLGKVQS